jgi:hypothetical protein
MMDTSYIITDYCSIRNQKVSLHGKVIFESTEEHSAAFYTAVYKHFGVNYPKFYKMDNLCKLGFLLSEILLKDKNHNQRYSCDETGIILQNAASSIDTDKVHQLSVNDRAAYFPSPSVFVYTLANIVIGEICIRHKLFGESTFFIRKKFDIPGIHTYVKQLFDDRIVKSCITGWIESDGDHYDGMLCLVEKPVSDLDGIAIFEPEKLYEIYS